MTLFGIVDITTGLAVQVQAQSLPTNGLVAGYPLSGNANDASGNGLKGTTDGAAFVTNGLGAPNSAGSFDGSSSFISLPASSLLTPPQFTISTWVLSDNDATGSSPAGGVEGPIFFSTYHGMGAGMFLYINSGGQPALRLAGDSPDWVSAEATAPAIPTNTRVQIVGSYDGNIGSVFVNGWCQGTGPFTNYTPYSGMNPTMGAGDWSGLVNFFQGLISNIRIYHRALSSAEVQQLYAGESSSPGIVLKKAIKPSFSNWFLGANYQLQVSSDLINWTNQGAPFAPTNTVRDFPRDWDVDNWGQLYFRLQLAP